MSKIYSIAGLIVFLFLFAGKKGSAQEVEFSQFYHVPTHLNPSMIGFSAHPRLIVGYRNQWPNLGNAYQTMAASYDQHFADFRSSVGVSLIADRAGDGIYNTNFINALYAYQLPVTRNFGIKAGMQLGLIQKSIAQDKLIFLDQIDPLAGPDGSLVTAEAPLLETSKIMMDIGVGIMAFSNTFYMGGSFKHINAPDISFSGFGDQDNKLKVRSSFHLGNVFYFGDNKLDKSPFYVAPNALFVNQERFFQLNVGSYMGKGMLFGGGWYRHAFGNADAVIMLLGLRVGVFRFAYSSDFNVSELKSDTQAHEFTVSIDFGKTRNAASRQKLRNSLQCPEIFRP